MLNKLLYFLAKICEVGSFLSAVYACYHWIHTLNTSRPGRRSAPFFFLWGLFDESNFTDKGNYHRIRFLVGLIVTLALLVLSKLALYL